MAHLKFMKSEEITLSCWKIWKEKCWICLWTGNISSIISDIKQLLIHHCIYSECSLYIFHQAIFDSMPEVKALICRFLVFRGKNTIPRWSQRQRTVNDSFLTTSTDDVMRGVCEYGRDLQPIPPAINQSHWSTFFRDLTGQLRGVGFW